MLGDRSLTRTEDARGARSQRRRDVGDPIRSPCMVVNYLKNTVPSLASGELRENRSGANYRWQVLFNIIIHVIQSIIQLDDRERRILFRHVFQDFKSM